MSDFTITEEIHAGEDTVLCRGTRISDGAGVLVKLLRRERPSSREIEKLRYEYRILRDLDIPGVIRPYGLEKHQGGLALVMEDPGGGVLADLLRDRRLDPRTALEIAASLAATLEALHDAQVIHKDVNPSSVTFDPVTGRVTLMSFGVAIRLVQEDRRPQSMGAIEGTLAYMSPEQTGRTNRTLDHRTDLYSLGVTLYELLAGRVPFSSVDPTELVHSHVARKPAPLQELLPELPVVVSEIVSKLLAKAAEDRYQTAGGLCRDLRECLTQLAATGTIVPFPLGRHDIGGQLRVPQKLYGREAEIQTLLSVFDEVARGGGAELLLVSGSAGIGKSVLVNELREPITGQRGFFISGKFDQLSRTVPYAPIAQAFRELVRDLLSGPEAQRDRLRSDLSSALGAIAQVLVEIIPELGALLGPQPPVPELGPSESQNRFALAFQSVLRVLGTIEHPLVLFLDDLQWADPASLKLLQILLSSVESACVLIIGAYRGGEVDPSHPLSLALDDLRKAGAKIREIDLAPLDGPTVTRLLADTLGCDPKAVEPLSEIIFELSYGNPFFIGQLLQALHRERLITFDADARAWTWDHAGVLQAGIPDNVVAFLAAKIRRLPGDTQRALTLAACIGHQFDLRTLSIICDEPPARTAGSLWAALQSGLIAPLDTEYRFLHVEDDARGDATPVTSRFRISYRFLHDRVQQAAYSLIEEGRRQEVHLKIGRRMLESREDGADEGGEDLFPLVHHLDLGALLIHDRAEQVKVARLNLVAGRRAKQATDYDTAAGALAAGLSLLGEAGWDDAFDLTRALALERAQCDYLSNRFEDAEALFAVLLGRARDNLQRGEIENLRVVLYCAKGEVHHAVDVGREALSMLGIDLPERPEELGAALGAALGEVQANLRGRPIEALIDAPAMTDPEKQLALRLLANVFSSAYVVSPLLLALIAVVQTNVNLQYGHSEMSPFGYMAYGFVLATMDQFESAYAFGRLALAVHERFDSADLTSKLDVLFAMNINYCRKPLRTSLPYFSEALTEGRTAGDFNFMCYAAIGIMGTKLGLGDDLELLREETDKLLSVVERTRTPANAAIMTTGKQLIAALTGRTRALGSLDDGSFDDAAFVETLRTPSMSTARCWHGAARLQLLLLAEDHEGGLAMADDAEQFVAAATGYYFLIDLSFHLCLTLLQLPQAEGPAREEREARLARHRARLDVLAAACPANFLHKRLLVAAEEARAGGDRAAAIDRYDQSIRAARESGFTQDEALAGELAARFYLRAGHDMVARGYLTDAHARYRAWGAFAKVRAIEERYAALLGPLEASRAGEAASMIDVATMIKASQALSAEIDLDALLTRLMSIALENAGAERGCLLRERADGLHVEAEACVEGGEIRVRLRSAGEIPVDLPRSLLGCVKATRESVVLDDATVAAKFLNDDYIARTRPKSVLCLALLRQASLTGLLYLENNLIAGAFTPAKLSLLDIIASQAAISLDNAALYARVTQENVERRRAEEEVRKLNSELERRVRKRTADLDAANKELEAFSYSVSHDLRTPLRAINGFSQALEQDHAGELSDDARDLVARVRKAGLRMSELIADLLHLSRVTRAEMARTRVDLSAMAREILTALKKGAPERDITSVIADGIVVEGDAHLLRIVLENLLGNAFKFTSKHPSARIELGVEDQPDGRPAYYVRDDGAGFDMKYAGKLFGAFQRLHLASEFDGTGVGLATVRRIVTRHGGRIWAVGAVEQGATFYFSL